MHRLAAVAAGAYPPRRPSNVWSPAVPAPPGPCYWLVASGPILGWRGGCLALRLVRGAVHHYCPGGCSALVVCVRRSRPVRGSWGRCRVLCLPRFPLPAPRFLRCVWRAVPSGCPLSSLAGTPFHAVCAFAGSVRSPFWYCPRVLCVCVRSGSRGIRAPPLPRSAWRAQLARSRCWAPVGPFRAVRAPPRVLPRSCARLGLLGGGGGGGPVRFPPCLAWGCVAPLGDGTVRALAIWLCALWGRHEGTWEGRLLPECGASGVGRSPIPDRSSFGACCRGPLPTGCRCGGCGRGDASRTPLRALLRAGFACCGGSTRAPGVDASCLGVGRPGLGALPLPTARPLGRAAKAHYPLALGAGDVGVGTRHQPTARALASWLCALWGQHEGAWGGRLLPVCGVSGVRRSLTPDRSSFGACCRAH